MFYHERHRQFLGVFPLNQVMNLYKNANNIPLIDERKIEHIEYTDLNSLSEEKKFN